jgi:hypothetical protein
MKARNLGWLAMSLALAGTLQPAHAGKPKTTLSFVCAKERGIPAEIQTLVKPLMAKYHDQGVANYGDRAAVLEFGEPVARVFFIPLSCGATGNCVWAVLGGAPIRNLGVVFGAVIQVDHGQGWPKLDTFSHWGAGEGDRETLTLRDGQYRRETVAKLKPEAVDRFMACVDNETCCPTASNLTTR